MFSPLRRVGIGILLDVPTRIGPEDEEDDEEDFLEDEEMDSMSLGGECQVINFWLQELHNEDEGEEYQFLGFLLLYHGLCPSFSFLQNL